MIPEMMPVRQWQDNYRAGAYKSKDVEIQQAAGWWDWHCRDDALAGHLKQIAPVVMGITDPFILDNFYIWFKNNRPVAASLYDDVRFQPLTREGSKLFFVISKDSPRREAKWVLYTERHGFQEPEFQCGNVREMVRYVNQLGPELQQGTPDAQRHLPSKAKALKQKETER